MQEGIVCQTGPHIVVVVVAQLVKTFIASLKFLDAAGKIGHHSRVGTQSFQGSEGKRDLFHSRNGRRQFGHHGSHQIGVIFIRLSYRLALLGRSHQHHGTNPN